MGILTTSQIWLAVFCVDFFILTNKAVPVSIGPMLKIRLQRVGRKHEPTFRVVLTDSKNSTKSGRFLELLGSYDPRKTTESFNGERIKEWMGKGAKLSDTMHNLLVSKKIIDGKKINVLPKKTAPAKEVPVEEVKAEAPASSAPAETLAVEAPALELAADSPAEIVAEATPESTPEETPAPENV